MGDNITNLNAPRTKILLKTYSLKSRNFTIYLEKHAYLIYLDKNHYRNYNNINVPSEPAELHSTLYQEFIMHNYFNYSKLSKVGQEELHVLKDINKMGKVMESQMGVYEIYNCPKKMAYGDWSDKITLYKKLVLHVISEKKTEIFTRINEPLIRRKIGWAVKKLRVPNLQRRFVHCSTPV